jgi:hypothetical protein
MLRGGSRSSKLVGLLDALDVMAGMDVVTSVVTRRAMGASCDAARRVRSAPAVDQCNGGWKWDAWDRAESSDAPEVEASDFRRAREMSYTRR